MRRVYFALFGIAYLFAYYDQYDSNLATDRALLQAGAPRDCVDAGQLAWGEWLSADDEDVRRARCAKFHSAIARSRWHCLPNPLTVLVRFATVLLLEPMLVLFESLGSMYFSLLVNLGATQTLLLFVVTLTCITMYLRARVMLRHNHHHQGDDNTNVWRTPLPSVRVEEVGEWSTTPHFTTTTHRIAPASSTPGSPSPTSHAVSVIDLVDDDYTNVKVGSQPAVEVVRRLPGPGRAVSW